MYLSLAFNVSNVFGHPTCYLFFFFFEIYSHCLPKKTPLFFTASNMRQSHFPQLAHKVQENLLQMKVLKSWLLPSNSKQRTKKKSVSFSLSPLFRFFLCVFVCVLKQRRIREGRKDEWNTERKKRICKHTHTHCRMDCSSSLLSNCESLCIYIFICNTVELITLNIV